MLYANKKQVPTHSMSLNHRTLRADSRKARLKPNDSCLSVLAQRRRQDYRVTDVLAVFSRVGAPTSDKTFYDYLKVSCNESGISTQPCVVVGGAGDGRSLSLTVGTVRRLVVGWVP